MKSKQPYFLFLAFLNILLFGGCMVGKQYSKPGAPTGMAYRDTLFTDSSQLMKWFELYKDPILQKMVKQTLDSNRDMLTAASRIEEARAQTAVIKANLFPKLGYQGQAGGGKAGSEALKVAGGIDGGYLSAYGLLNWELDIWGKLRRSTQAAYADFLASVENRHALQVSLVGEVATQYFLLRDLDNRLLVSTQTLDARTERTKIITDRFNKGYVSELDELMAIQQQTLASTQIPALRRQIIQTENSLRLLMGMGPGTVERGLGNFEQTLTPDIPVGLSSQLLDRRPDIRSAEKSLQAQFERIGVAQANRLPSISLTGLLGFASPQLSTFVSGNGFVANGFGIIAGPLFNFNQNKKLVEVERKRTDQLYYQYQGVVLSAFGDVDNALAEYKTLTEEYAQRLIQVEAAQKALVLSRARYDSGFTSYLEVTILENNLFDAQLLQSITLQQKLSSIVGLYKALGGGWDITQ
jgi:outer membrane protein, multidrug efflux system